MNYVKYILKENGNSLLKEIFLDSYEKQSTSWARTIKEYLKETNLNFEGLRNTKNLDKVIKELDTKKWKEEISQKSTLSKYASWKTEIKGEEKIYGNSLDSAILFRARTNTLDLQWRKKITNEDTTCQLCGKEEETLDHFILDCEKLNDVRSECLILAKPQMENRESILKSFLFFRLDSDTCVTKYKKTLYKLWKTRKECMKNSN